MCTPTSDNEVNMYVKNKAELRKTHQWSHEAFNFFRQFFHSNRSVKEIKDDAVNDEDADLRDLNGFKFQLYMGSVFGPACLLSDQVG